MNTVRQESNVLYRVGVLFIALVIGLLLFGFTKWAWYSPAEMKAYDLLLHLRGTTAPRPDIAIVGIDSNTISALGPLPWSNAQHARIVRALNRVGAKVVVYDMLFSEADTRAGADISLRNAISARKNVILPMAYDPLRTQAWNAQDTRSLIELERFAIPGRIRYSSETPFYKYYYFTPPLPEFVRAADGVGVALGQGGGTDVVREAKLAFLSNVEYPVPSQTLPANMPMPKFINQTVVLQGLPLIVSNSIFAVDKSNVNVDFTRSVSLTADLNPYVDIPINEYGGMLINFSGSAGTYPQFSAIDLLRGRVSASNLSGKTVLVGVTDAASPFPAWLDTPYGYMPRVEITANSVGTILDRSFIVRSRAEALIVLLALALILGLLYPVVSQVSLGRLALGLSIAYVLVAILVMALFRHAWPVFSPIALVLLTAVAAGLLKPFMFTPVEVPLRHDHYERPEDRAA